MKDERDKLVVYLAWYTGARLGECLSVRPEDIYKDKNQVFGSYQLNLIEL